MYYEYRPQTYSTPHWNGIRAIIIILFVHMVHTYMHYTYRVAQNKIPQQTICNFSATSWSYLIMTLLRIEQCTMYPPRLNYVTTLPCKTLTMKIAIFIIMLHWNQKKTSLATSSKLCENSLSQNMFKEPPPAFTVHTSSKSFDDAQYNVALLTWVLWQIVPHWL